MTFIYRCIDSGMVTMTEVKSGAVSLADLAGITHYLDMKADIEYANMGGGADNGSPRINH